MGDIKKVDQTVQTIFLKEEDLTEKAANKQASDHRPVISGGEIQTEIKSSGIEDDAILLLMTPPEDEPLPTPMFTTSLYLNIPLTKDDLKTPKDAAEEKKPVINIKGPSFR